MTRSARHGDARDQEIRRLAPFVVRATKCKREVAIEFLCSLGKERREVIRALRMLEMLNKTPTHRMRRPATRRPCMDEVAWCKPR